MKIGCVFLYLFKTCLLSQTCGIEGAFELLKYFGVLKDGNLKELFSQLPSPGLADIHALLPGYESIEKLCNYRFKNKCYLLQAFTHPSYTSNHVTDCYQKLEFIGDAVLGKRSKMYRILQLFFLLALFSRSYRVLDFLITSYIYQYCGQLTPGQLTDLRSALVNNITFGALVVRLQLHKHLLCHSQCLWEAIRTFVNYQESKNYEIHGNEVRAKIIQ
jgi:hypothetical protein